jgi:hypothetical protein
MGGYRWGAEESFWQDAGSDLVDFLGDLYSSSKCMTVCIGRVALGEAATSSAAAGAQKIVDEVAELVDETGDLGKACRVVQRAIPIASRASTAFSALQAMNCIRVCG